MTVCLNGYRFTTTCSAAEVCLHCTQARRHTMQEVATAGAHHIDECQLVLVDGIHMGGVVALGKNAAMDAWMQRLHPPCRTTPAISKPLVPDLPCSSCSGTIPVLIIFDAPETAPSSISGKPVSSSTRVTGTPMPSIALALLAGVTRSRNRAPPGPWRAYPGRICQTQR